MHRVDRCDPRRDHADLIGEILPAAEDSVLLS
jgi:hypothetical protein